MTVTPQLVSSTLLVSLAAVESLFRTPAALAIALCLAAALLAIHPRWLGIRRKRTRDHLAK